MDEIQALVHKWSIATTESFSACFNIICQVWDENNEKEYDTDKPDWPAFVLVAACRQYKIRLPKQVKREWDFLQDPAVKRALADAKFTFQFLKGNEWWLPFDTVHHFTCQTPNHKECSMGTTAGLLYELRQINELCFNVRDQECLNWAKMEGYPVDREVQNGFINKFKNRDYEVLSLAKFAFSLFYQAALFSQKNKVPIIMDY